MSTIHDALKKVQDDMTPQQEENTTPQPQEPSAPHNPFNASPPPLEEKIAEETPELPKKKINIINVIFIVIIICGLGYGVYSLTTSSELTSFQDFKASKLSIKPKKVSAPVARPQEGLYIQGTMAVGNRHVALISGDIYEVNDSIAEKQITKITKNEVYIINEAGEEKILKVSK